MLSLGRRGLRFRHKPRVHFLHIGKTGGSAIKAALRPAATRGRFEIVLHPHGDGLRVVPPGEPVFFVLRDPLERFVSGFNSRQRCGRPRHNVLWSPAERVAFERFATPDALACSLSAEQESLRLAAHRAMASIGHVRESYWRWFETPEYLEERRADLMLIMWLPELDSGFGRLCELLGLPDLRLPTDEVGAHRAPKAANRHLSELAVANLLKWYEDDLQFVQLCMGMSRFAAPVPA